MRRCSLLTCLSRLGFSCFINRQLIYNYPEQLFTDAGIMAIEHADFEGIERLVCASLGGFIALRCLLTTHMLQALVTGAEICSTFDHPELAVVGKCDLIEELMIGEDRVIKFSGVPKGEACTIVLRGASSRKSALADLRVCLFVLFLFFLFLLIHCLIMQIC